MCMHADILNHKFNSFNRGRDIKSFLFLLAPVLVTSVLEKRVFYGFFENFIHAHNIF